MEILLLLYLIFCGALFTIISIMLAVELTDDVCPDDKLLTNWFTKKISKLQAVFLSVIFSPTVVMLLTAYPILIAISAIWNYMGKIGMRS